MKKTILFILVIWMACSVIALADDSSIVKTSVHISWDRNGENEAVLTVTGENLNWVKTLIYNSSVKDNETGEMYGMPGTWSEDLEILMVREFGNYTDVLYVINECNEMANFSRQWETCNIQREECIIDALNNKVNKTTYDEDIGNLTEQKESCESSFSAEKSSLNSRINELTEENTELKNNRKWGWLLGIGGIGIAGYVFVRYKGWGRRKHQDETEHSVDVSR